MFTLCFKLCDIKFMTISNSIHIHMHTYFMHTYTHTYTLLDFSVMDVRFRYQRNMLLNRIVRQLIPTLVMLLLQHQQYKNTSYELIVVMAKITKRIQNH